MKKHLLSAALLVLLATGAQASTVYYLSNIAYDNIFSGGPVAGSVTCTGCGIGTAVDDGSGNITLTGISWYYLSGANEYTNTINGTTTLAPTYTPVTTPANSLPAGSVLTRTGGVCTDIQGANCLSTNIRSGLSGSFYTGLASNGTTPCGGSLVNTSNIAAIDRCRVDLSLVGTTLTMQIKRALSESTTSGSWGRLTFTFEAAAVPVPAAAWLFGSALGLLGLARRKFV